MSIGAQSLSLFSFLQNEGLLKSVATVAELGSIEYEIKEPETDRVFERFFERLDAPVPTGRNPETGLYKGSAHEFYECLGYQHIALDLDGRFGSRVFDLNHDELPPELVGWSDLTTNLGTAEHVFDQAHCFRIMHELTKPGGLMLHWAPSQNMPLHGFFQYGPPLYYSLTEFNDYEMVGQWVSTLDPTFWLPARVRPEIYFASKKIIATLLRKTSSSGFVVPLQINAPQEPNAGALDRYGVTTFKTDKRLPPPRYDTAFIVDFATLQSRKVPMDEVMEVDEWRRAAEGGLKSPLVKLREHKQVMARQREKIRLLEAELARRNAPQASRFRRGVRSLRAKLAASRPRPR